MMETIPSESLLGNKQPEVKPIDESDEEKNDEKIDAKEEPSQQNQNTYLDDSDDNEEAVEVRMGQDSASRDYS